MNCEALLLLPHLRVQNANAISGPLSWGFPAVTAFTGFVHALQRRLLQDEQLDIELDGVAIVCHHFAAQVAPAGYNTYVFSLNRPGVHTATQAAKLEKDGALPAIVEEGRVHLEVSLLIGVNGDLPAGEGLAERILQTALSMRLAGGSVLPSTQRAQLLERTGSQESDEQVVRKLRRRLLPGFALVGRRDLLTEHTTQLQAADPQVDTLDALLDLTRLNIDPPQADAEQDSPAAGWHVRPRGGWLVPIPVGYRALGEVQPAGSVRNARDRDTPFCFVESLYSLGQWLSPHRVRDLSELFWYHRADPDAGLYLCETTDYLPQDSE